MRKSKLWKTVDCVVAGIYRKAASRAVKHLLLGLYDDDELLHYVGRGTRPMARRSESSSRR